MPHHAGRLLGTAVHSVRDDDNICEPQTGTQRLKKGQAFVGKCSKADTLLQQATALPTSVVYSLHIVYNCCTYISCILTPHSPPPPPISPTRPLLLTNLKIPPKNLLFHR